MGHSLSVSDGSLPILLLNHQSHVTRLRLVCSLALAVIGNVQVFNWQNVTCTSCRTTNILRRTDWTLSVSCRDLLNITNTYRQLEINCIPAVIHLHSLLTSAGLLDSPCRTDLHSAVLVCQQLPILELRPSSPPLALYYYMPTESELVYTTSALDGITSAFDDIFRPRPTVAPESAENSFNIEQHRPTSSKPISAR